MLLCMIIIISSAVFIALHGPITIKTSKESTFKPHSWDWIVRHYGLFVFTQCLLCCMHLPYSVFTELSSFDESTIDKCKQHFVRMVFPHFNLYGVLLQLKPAEFIEGHTDHLQ